MHSRNLFKIRINSQDFVFFIPSKFRYNLIKDQSNRDFELTLVEHCVVDPNLTRQEILNMSIGIISELAYAINNIFKKC